MSQADSRGSMGRKPHYDVTKTDAQKAGKGTEPHDKAGSSDAGDIELKTPSGFLSGLSGINKPSNSSSATNVGSGNYGDHTQSSRPGIEGNAPKWSKNSSNKNFGA